MIWWANLPKIAKNGQITYKRVFLVLYALGTYNLVCRSQEEYRLRYKTFDLIRWAKLPKVSKISKSHLSVFLYRSTYATKFLFMSQWEYRLRYYTLDLLRWA